MANVHLAKYGASFELVFDLVAPDGVDLVSSAVHAAGDSKISKNGASYANTTNGFTSVGEGTYKITLTATEMQAARIKVKIVDQDATKVWLDRVISIYTFGNASAHLAVDLDDSTRAGLSALPNAAADAAGGLPISDAGGLDLDTLLAELSSGNIPADLDTLLARLTATRAGYLDNLSAGAAALESSVQGLNDLSQAQAQSAAEAALVAKELDHLLAVAYDPASKPGNASALWNQIVENDAGVPRFTTNALENAPSGTAASHYGIYVVAVGTGTPKISVAVWKNGQVVTNATDLSLTIAERVPGSDPSTKSTVSASSPSSDGIFDANLGFTPVSGTLYSVKGTVTVDSSSRSVVGYFVAL